VPLVFQYAFRRAFRHAFRIFAAGFALSFAVCHSADAATPETFRALEAEVVGKGRPVLMIPGLTAPARPGPKPAPRCSGCRVSNIKAGPSSARTTTSLPSP
jgi:hypothetical protein